MIEDLARTEDFERRWVRKEPYVEGTPTEGGPFVVHCDGDDCKEKLGPYYSEAIAKITAIEAGWVTIAHKKLTGIAHRIYCTTCKRKKQT